MSRKVTSKAKSKAKVRRKIRLAEKGSRLFVDKLIGACARRNYGQGLASNS